MGLLGTLQAFQTMQNYLECGEAPNKQRFQYTSGMLKLTISNSTLSLTSQDMSSKACQSQKSQRGATSTSTSTTTTTTTKKKTKQKNNKDNVRTSITKMKTARYPKSFKNYPRASVKEGGVAHTNTKGIPRSQNGAKSQRNECGMPLR